MTTHEDLKKLFEAIDKCGKLATAKEFIGIEAYRQNDGTYQLHFHNEGNHEAPAKKKTK